MSATLTNPTARGAVLGDLQSLQELDPNASIDSLHHIIKGIRSASMDRMLADYTKLGFSDAEETAQRDNAAAAFVEADHMLKAMEGEKQTFRAAMANLLWDFDEKRCWDYRLLPTAEGLRRELKTHGLEATKPEGKYLRVISEYRRRWMGAQEKKLTWGWEDLWVYVAGRPMVMVE